ncbi:MAG: CpaE family protein [Hyphomicrobiales bacterium]
MTDSVDRDDGADVRPVPRISLQAFCDTNEIYAVIEAASADRRFAKVHVKAHMGGIPAAVEFYGSAPTPNVIVVECRLSAERLLGELERLAEVCDPGSKVVVIGHVNDVDLYRDLLRRGVSEYVVAPFAPMDFIRTISHLYSEQQSKPLGRTIAFYGARGGVGSSTVAHNVAWSMARLFDTDVALIDLDLPFGTAGLDFNQDPTQGIADAVFSSDRVDDVFLDRLLAKCNDHLNLLAAPATLEKTYDFSADAFSTIVEVAQKGVPTVVLDVPHMWTGWTRKVLTMADEIIVVAAPDLANLRNAKNIVDNIAAARPNDHAPHLVLNQVNVPKRPEIKPAEFAGAIGLPALAAIPFEPQLFGTAANNGQMIGEAAPKSEIAEMFDQIADQISGRSPLKRGKRSSLSPFLSKLLMKKSA